MERKCACAQSICKACRTVTAAHAPVLLELAQRASALPQPTAVALLRALAAALGRLPEEQVLRDFPFAALASERSERISV